MKNLEARHLSGAHVGQLILDSEGQPWRIVEVHHYPSGVVLEIHHPDTESWATREPLDEVEYDISDIVTVRLEANK